MSTGGNSQQVPTDTISRQTNLPEYADPYFRRLLQGAEESLMPFEPVIDPETGQVALDDFGNEQYQTTYRPYQGERIAPSEMYGDIQGSRAMVRGIAESGISGMPEAMGAARLGMGYQDEAIQGLRGLADYGTGQFDPYSGFFAGQADPYAGFEAQQVDPFAGFQQARATSMVDQFQEFNPNQYQGFREAEFSPFGEFDEFQFRGPAEFSEFNFRPDYQFEGFQYQEPERFSGGAVQDYMSPYMQSVVDQQKSQAQLDFERQGASRAAQAVQAGAFGGSRQAVQESLAEEALGRQMGDIQARGSQAAFEQAAQQFGLDRAARMETERAQAGEFARVQAGSAAEQARVDQARFTELASREQAQAAEFARAGDQASAEAARVQASKFQDLARIQAGKASEMGRVQGAQASENARMDAIMQQEMARVQQSRAGEQARLDDFMRSEMGRTQELALQAQGAETLRVCRVSLLMRLVVFNSRKLLKLPAFRAYPLKRLPVFRLLKHQSLLEDSAVSNRQLSSPVSLVQAKVLLLIRQWAVVLASLLDLVLALLVLENANEQPTFRVRSFLKRLDVIFVPKIKRVSTWPTKTSHVSATIRSVSMSAWRASCAVYLLRRMWKSSALLRTIRRNKLWVQASLRWGFIEG
jgi:hypothetical protein